jgi:hypothetical protein
MSGRFLLVIWPWVRTAGPTVIQVKPPSSPSHSTGCDSFFSDLPSVALPSSGRRLRERDDGTRRRQRRRGGAWGLRLLQVRRPAPQDLCKRRPSPIALPVRLQLTRARTLPRRRGVVSLELGPSSSTVYSGSVSFRGPSNWIVLASLSLELFVLGSVLDLS